MILAVVELITLHMIDGRVVQINPKQVTQLVSGRPAGGPNKMLPDEVHCVVEVHLTGRSCPWPRTAIRCVN